MILHQCDPSEIGLAFAPLSEVSAKLAASMHSDGTDSHCGICRKQFTIARKPRGIARVVHQGESGVMCSTWLICGRCKHKAKLDGGKVPAAMLDQARRSYEALRLLRAAPGGTA